MTEELYTNYTSSLTEKMVPALPLPLAYAARNREIIRLMLQ